MLSIAFFYVATPYKILTVLIGMLKMQKHIRVRASLLASGLLIQISVGALLSQRLLHCKLSAAYSKPYDCREIVKSRAEKVLLISAYFSVISKIPILLIGQGVCIGFVLPDKFKGCSDLVRPHDLQ